jgi:hypothetical protein
MLEPDCRYCKERGMEPGIFCKRLAKKFAQPRMLEPDCLQRTRDGTWRFLQ